MNPYFKVKCQVDNNNFGFPMEACIVDVASLKYELYNKLPKNVQFIQGNIDKIENNEASISVQCNNIKHTGFMAFNTLGKYNKFSADIKRFDYHEVGIVASLELERDNVVGFQRFLPSGPIALLPTGLRSASLVWTLPRNTAESILNLKEFDVQQRTNLINLSFQNQEYDVEFKLNELNQDLMSDHGDYFPYITSCGPFNSFPLGFHHLSEYGRDRLVAIGDAAHSIHPLAGMGLNLGLGDVKTLDAIFQNIPNLEKQTIIDDVLITEEFEKKNHYRNSSMIWACDMMHDLFATRGTFFSGIRNLSTKFFKSETFWSNVMQERVNKLY